MPHRIRLGPPWETAPEAGRARHSRRFGRPRTLAPGEQVWLVLPGLAPDDVVELNGAPLAGPRPAFECDVTAQLQPRNRLDVVSIAPAPDGAALEIR